MGLRGKRGKDKKSTGWFRDAVLSVYTLDWVKRDLEAATPEVRLRLVGSWVPKEMKVDNNSTFQLVITGLANKAVKGELVQHDALDTHNDDE